MARYEYRVEHKPATSRVAQINERLSTLAEEGWEPIAMSGDAEINILLRRAVSGTATTAAAGVAQVAAVAEQS